VAVSIHRASDVPRGRRVARGINGLRAVGGGIIPYTPPAVGWAAAAVTLFAFGIYLRTMMPSTGFWDTGEAQTVPHTLSIFHPTGFPTYTLVGWLWSQLPFGSVAWRMNLLSAVSVALAAGLVVLITGHLVQERHRVVAAGSAAIAGGAFAFAAEPWAIALRADVHALHVLIAALIVWLLLVWAAAERAGARRAGWWLAGAALAFGIGLGNHPLTGLMAFGIAVWIVTVRPDMWRRWRLALACAALLLLGVLGTYAYIPIRAAIDPEPPLFYARPDTLDRLRYLVFAEQFHNLFDEFNRPFSAFGAKWVKTESVLQLQYWGPGWLFVAWGAATLAVRRLGAFVLLGLIAAGNVLYSMNFRDGDIDRYYLTTVVATAPLLGVAVASVATAFARAGAEITRRTMGRIGRRRVAALAGGIVLLLAAALPAASLASLYRTRDQSTNYDADRWVESVFAALPRNAVVMSWWSYSTPLWYHRWVLGERPDVTIIDERNILDDGYATLWLAVRSFYPERAVYIVPPEWDYRRIVTRYDTVTVQTYPGYTDLLRVEGL
jgi:Protein of unknown function (DUF2723)